MTGYSAECLDLTSYLDLDQRKCVKCQLKAGHEIAPNCGRGDDGSIHERYFKPCKSNTFNEGNSPNCKPCSPCPSGVIAKNCTSTEDTFCQPLSSTHKNEPKTSITTLTLQPTKEINPDIHTAASWPIPFAIIVTAMLFVLCVFTIYRKRKKGQRTMTENPCGDRKSSYENEGFLPSDKNIGLENVLDVNICSASLKTALDNLDVLEELVILLDPEIQGVKNTKHLASLCFFPSTWITYAYSMKESKSPLKAVLEGLTSKYPDWTVGHLAKLLRQMERNDAIAVLAKLRPSPHIYG